MIINGENGIFVVIYKLKSEYKFVSCYFELF